MDKLNTNYKYITILDVKYCIKSSTLLVPDPKYMKETVDIRTFNWDNIKPEYVRYSND